MGVCGGIAHTYGWNPTAVRLAVAALTLFIPGPNVVVILAYIVLGAILPESRAY
jgi:phage shock protein PspC (stress-responsive transcriptional regulator)